MGRKEASQRAQVYFGACRLVMGGCHESTIAVSFAPAVQYLVTGLCGLACREAAFGRMFVVTIIICLVSQGLVPMVLLCTSVVSRTAVRMRNSVMTCGYGDRDAKELAVRCVKTTVVLVIIILVDGSGDGIEDVVELVMSMVST